MNNKMKTINGIVLSMGFLLVGGCASLDRISVQPIYASAETEDDFVKVDLPTLLNPDGKTEQSLEKAFAAFYTRGTTDPNVAKKVGTKNGDKEITENLLSGPGTLERLRNSVQARLIAASNVECGRYRSRLLRVQSGVNFGLGTLTTTLGAAGAIVTGGSWSQGLSGASAVFNSSRSAFNENFFRQLAIEQITRAIAGRRDLYIQGLAPRRKLSISEYTVEYAVADAMEYHSMCSLIAGLEFSSEAIANMKDPGLKWFGRVLEESGVPNVTIDTSKIKTRDGFFPAPPVVDIDKAVGSDPKNTDPLRGAVTPVEKEMSHKDGLEIQQALCLKGDQVDGIFGKTSGPTRLAIKEYQTLNTLTSVEGRGFLDQVTLNNLKADKDCPSQFSNYYERFHLSPTDAIKNLQSVIGLPENKRTGILDDDTRTKIKEVQKTNGLPQTGIVNEAFLKLFPSG